MKTDLILKFKQNLFPKLSGQVPLQKKNRFVSYTVGADKNEP